MGWGECQQKNIDCNVRKVYFCILINIVQFLIQCPQRVKLNKILNLEILKSTDQVISI